jgi:hypothetical protein
MRFIQTKDRAVNVARAHYNHQRTRNPCLASLVRGGELASHDGTTIVVLETIYGQYVVYVVNPITGWRLRPATPQEARNLGIVPAEVRPTETLEAELRTAVDKMLTVSAALEARVREAGKPHHHQNRGRGNGAGEAADHSIAAE